MLKINFVKNLGNNVGLNQLMLLESLTLSMLFYNSQARLKREEVYVPEIS